MTDDNMEVVSSFELLGKKVEIVKDPNKEADFKNDVVIPDFLGTGFNVTETIFNTWIIMGIIIIFCIACNIAMRKFKEIPTGFQNGLEAIIEIFENFTKQTMGKHNLGFAPFYFTIFTFEIFYNIACLFPTFFCKFPQFFCVFLYFIAQPRLYFSTPIRSQFL